MKRSNNPTQNPARRSTVLPVATLIAILGATLSGRATDSVSDFDRYQPIAKRNPFGSPPAPAAPATAAAASSAQFRMSALVEIGGSVRVGLVDLQTQRSLYLRVGESEEGVELVSADSSQEQAVIRRGAETLTLRLQEGAVPSPAPVVSAALPPTARGGPPEGGRSRRDQILQQMRERREAARLATMQTEGSASTGSPPATVENPPDRESREGRRPRVTGPEMERRLQEYQMEVIRQGLPPLPIPLTEEMDKQLVAEGVLPPQ